MVLCDVFTWLYDSKEKDLSETSFYGVFIPLEKIETFNFFCISIFL